MHPDKEKAQGWRIRKNKGWHFEHGKYRIELRQSWPCGLPGANRDEEGRIWVAIERQFSTKEEALRYLRDISPPVHG